MKKITIQLKPGSIRWADFGGIKLSEESPSIELSEVDAVNLMADQNAHLLEIASEREEADLTKEQLQALFVETIGADPDKRLSPAKLKQAIDEYNANVPDTTNIGLADVAIPVVDPIIATTVDTVVTP